MNIVCSVGDTYLLEPQREPIVGWHHRPGTFRVATPYDRAPPSHKDNHGSTSDDRDTAQSGQRKKPKISNSTTEIPVVAQSPEENLAQWIRSRLIAVLDQPLAKTFVQNMALDYFYGTLVDTPASNELAPDFVNLQSVLQLLRSGFSGAPEPNLKEILLSESHQTLDLDDMYETIVSNNQSEPAVITVHSATRPRFIIPPRSTFIISDLDKIHDLKAIVMDPPWQNASVDRQARYNTIDLYDLFKIPVPELLKNDTDIVAQEAVGGLVAVWITNRNKVKKMVLEKLFPAWDLELVGHWYWLKVKSPPAANLFSISKTGTVVHMKGFSSGEENFA
ncbi:Methyltransferase-like protein 4 [Gryganskiella cystojenkinii]|nr:Methyltransferase-like protein 4 [Gryganskiella cystojenkinii]